MQIIIVPITLVLAAKTHDSAKTSSVGNLQRSQKNRHVSKDLIGFQKFDALTGESMEDIDVIVDNDFIY